MRITFNRLTLLFVAALLWGCQQTTATINFNHDWQFAMSEEDLDQVGLDGVQWESVALPHTAKIENKVITDQWQGTSWYYKNFELPKGSKQVYYLKFEGAMNACDIWINGQKVISKQGGYLPVVVDFTKVAKPGGKNLVLVRLDNRDNPVTGPKPLKILDFNMYGGLYRDAFLIIKNQVHISDPIEANLPASGGIFVTYPKADANEATVQVKTHIKNTSGKKKDVVVNHEIWKDKQMVASLISKKMTIDGLSDGEDISTINVANPQLWSPLTPSLYQLKTKVLINGKVSDETTTRIGIRRFEILKEGFFINGEKIQLRGVNRHQDYPYVGYALSNEAQYRDALKIKEAGFDYVRLSHYPHSPAFMDACDELGLVVLDAILGWQYFKRDSAFQEQIFQTGRELIRRDRNHACVIAWELSLNESWMDNSFIDVLHAITHQEYPATPRYSAGWQEYGYDVYLQARQHRLKHYRETPKPYSVSEYGDWEYYAQNAGLNQDAWADLQQDERTSRQLLADGEVRLLQQATNIQEAHNDNFKVPAFSDSYWVMFDYNRGYADDLEASGIMSIDRLPKFSYYFFKSQRPPSEKSDRHKAGPMVYIASWWNEQSPLHVRVFSNAQEVELFVNGRSLGKQTPDENNISDKLNHPPFTFAIDAFEKGELVAKAYIDGDEVATHSVKTPEIPAKYELVIDESGRAPKAGVNDVVFVYARLVDQNGTVAPINNIQVSFTIEGDALVLNPEAISTEAGIATALVRIGNLAAPVKISVTDSENRSGEIIIKPL